ncbi:MAG: class I SAM-dependent methyltransferase [Chloroflexi bacterium]|nr:class I SAM-dependent methyltransferase [Chloroflexota bacterium]
MHSSEYEIMYQVELRHWWYRGMASITRAVFDRWLPRRVGLRILDAGCGTGAAMTTYLRDFGTVTGCDLSRLALDFCHRRDASRLVQASVLDLPFAPASFDLVVSFDVLYERAVSNDLSALREFARLLAPGGFLFLRLPAYDWLRGAHDVVIHTARRYTTRRIADLLVQSGLALVHLSYANTLLFPAAALKRLSEQLLPVRQAASDLELEPGPFNGILHRVLAAEAPWVASRELPFGLSVIALARKSSIQ